MTIGLKPRLSQGHRVGPLRRVEAQAPLNGGLEPRTAVTGTSNFFGCETPQTLGKPVVYPGKKMVIDGKFAKFRIRMRIRMGIPSNLVKSDPKI